MCADPALQSSGWSGSWRNKRRQASGGKAPLDHFFAGFPPRRWFCIAAVSDDDRVAGLGDGCCNGDRAPVDFPGAVELAICAGGPDAFDRTELRMALEQFLGLALGGAGRAASESGKGDGCGY